LNLAIIAITVRLGQNPLEHARTIGEHVPVSNTPGHQDFIRASVHHNKYGDATPSIQA
jgi:hypothetical protein